MTKLTTFISKFPASFEDLKDHQNKDNECRNIYDLIKKTKRGLIIYKTKGSKCNRLYVPQALRALI